MPYCKDGRLDKMPLFSSTMWCIVWRYLKQLWLDIVYPGKVLKGLWVCIASRLSLRVKRSFLWSRSPKPELLTLWGCGWSADEAAVPPSPLCFTYWSPAPVSDPQHPSVFWWGAGESAQTFSAEHHSFITNEIITTIDITGDCSTKQKSNCLNFHEMRYWSSKHEWKKNQKCA